MSTMPGSQKQKDIKKEIEKVQKRLGIKKEDAKKIYNRVEKWLNDQKLSEEVLMPSFSEFAQGKKPNVTISGIDIPMAQLEQATYVKDPVVSDIVTKLGLDSNPVDEILNFMRKK